MMSVVLLVLVGVGIVLGCCMRMKCVIVLLLLLMLEVRMLRLNCFVVRGVYSVVLYDGLLLVDGLRFLVVVVVESVGMYIVLGRFDFI